MSTHHHRYLHIITIAYKSSQIYTHHHHRCLHINIYIYLYVQFCVRDIRLTNLLVTSTEGMAAFYNVKNCSNKGITNYASSSYSGTTREFFLTAEATIWKYGPTGLDGRTGLPLTTGDRCVNIDRAEADIALKCLYMIISSCLPQCTNYLLNIYMYIPKVTLFSVFFKHRKSQNMQRSNSKDFIHPLILNLKNIHNFFFSFPQPIKSLNSNFC